MEYLHPATHFAVFINFYSFLYFIPFKVVWDLNSSNYKIKDGSRFQKLLCVLQHILLTWYSLTTFKNSLMKVSENRWDINRWFQMISNAVYTTTGILLGVRSWFCQSQLKHLFSVLKLDSSGKIINRLHWWKPNTTALACLTCISHYLFGLFYSATVATTETGEVKRFAASLENSLLWILSELNCSIDKTALQYINYFLLAEGLQCAIFATSMEFTLYCVVFAAITLQQDFLSENSHIKTPSQLIQLYQHLKQKINTLNRYMGSMILVNYITFITYYAVIPSYLKGQNAISKYVIGVIIFMIVSILAWISTGSFHYKVRKAVVSRIRTFQQQETIGLHDRFRLMMVINELEVAPMAISCKFFNLTNTFLCSMAGVLLTYLIIIYQTGSAVIL